MSCELRAVRCKRHLWVLADNEPSGDIILTQHQHNVHLTIDMGLPSYKSDTYLKLSGLLKTLWLFVDSTIVV